MSQSKAQLLDPQGDFTLTGQLIGVGATFSGDVSIGGTLTKQDVTNVDSVGVVTARSGVNISGGNLQFGGTNVINSGLALYNLDSIKLADSKELKLGSSDDLKIYHNGAHSYIDEVGAGSLKVRGDDIRVENASGTERLRIGTGGGGSSIGINTTNNMVTNSEVISVYGTSSFKSTTQARPPLYLGNEGSTANVANQLILFNQGGANRGGIGYVPNTGELRFNNQYFITFNTGASSLDGTERLRITAAGSVGIATITPTDAWLDIASSAGTDSLRMRRLSSDVNVASNWSLKPYGKNLYFREGGNTDRVHFTDTGNVVTTVGEFQDAKGSLRSIPRSGQGSTYTLVASDAGKAIGATNTVTIPNGVMSSGDAVTIINENNSDITIAQGSGFTLYNASEGNNAAGGNRTLASRGLCTLYFPSNSQAYISGAGLS